MASIHLQGILLDTLGEVDVGAILTWTHLTNTGEVIATTKRDLIIPPDGFYSIDVEFGQIRIDYTTRFTERFIATVIVNGDSTATTIPELLNAAVPVTDPVILQMQDILSDTEAAKDLAEAAAEQITTFELIGSTAIFAPDQVVTTSGFMVDGDGGTGKWKQNGVTAQTPSKKPSQLNDALLNDGNGNQWEYVSLNANGKRIIPITALGAEDGQESTLEIQAAINGITKLRALQHDEFENSGTVYIPSGRYTVSDTLEISGDGTNFVGDGPGTSVLVRGTINYGHTIEIQSEIGVFDSGWLVFGVQLRDFSIDSSCVDIASLYSHIIVVGSILFQIHNVQIYGCAYTCLTIKGAGRYSINDFFFYQQEDRYPEPYIPPTNSAFIRLLRNGTGATVYTSSKNSGKLNNTDIRSLSSGGAIFHAAYYIQSTDGFWQTNCYAKRCTYSWKFDPMDSHTLISGVQMSNNWSDIAEEAGIYITGSNPDSSYANFFIKDMRFGGANKQNHAIKIDAVDAYNVRFSGLIINKMLDHSILIETEVRDLQLDHIRIYDQDVANVGGTNCIQIFEDIGRFIISDCILGGVGGGPGKGNNDRCIHMQSGTSDDFIIVNNDCSRFQDIPIKLSTSTPGQNVRVTDNALGNDEIFTVVSSGTLNFLLSTSDFIDVTGTTNIGGIQSASAWLRRQVTLKFNDVLTVDNTGNIKLQAPLVTAANMTLTLKCDGVDWYPI